VELPLFLRPVDVDGRHWAVVLRQRRQVRWMLDVGGEGLLKRLLRGVEGVPVVVVDGGAKNETARVWGSGGRCHRVIGLRLAALAESLCEAAA
jgi:hypothetical protein